MRRLFFLYYFTLYLKTFSFLLSGKLQLESDRPIVSTTL